MTNLKKIENNSDKKSINKELKIMATNYVTISILIIIITISLINNIINTNSNSAWAQNQLQPQQQQQLEQQEQQEQTKDNVSKSNIRTLQVTFDSININKFYSNKGGINPLS